MIYVILPDQKISHQKNCCDGCFWLDNQLVSVAAFEVCIWLLLTKKIFKKCPE